MHSASNQQDANASTSTQQAQRSLQAQDTSPPTLSTTQPQDHHDAIVTRPKRKQRQRKSMNCLSMSIAILLMMIIGSIVWVLSIIISLVFWSNICNIAFAVIGNIMGLLQLYFQLTPVPVLTPQIALLSADVQPFDPFNRDFSIPHPDGQEGVLVVYTKRSLRGSSIALCQGFWDNTNPYAAQSISECKIRGHTYYIAVFESLPPGPYTAYIYRREMTAKITIYPGKVTTIDWR